MSRILNVEDDAPTRFLKSRILERAGFQVIEAVNCADAVRTASDDSLQLVLLDLRLPDGDGYEVCEQIKKTRPALPVIMITSTYTTTQGRQDGLTSGADAYLIEPVSAERLLHIVRKFLDPGQAVPDQDLDAWIVTDDRGTILEISEPGHRLLNLSARGSIGRNLAAFFPGDRHQVFGDIARALDGQVTKREAQMRPRDRRAFRAHVEISREVLTGSRQARLRWTIEPLQLPSR